MIIVQGISRQEKYPVVVLHLMISCQNNRLNTACDTESHIVALVYSCPAAESGSGKGTTYSRVAEPAAAACHIKTVIITEIRFFILRKILPVRHAWIPVILTKFKYIPVHIVEFPGVRYFLTHWMCSAAAVTSVPAGSCQVSFTVSGIE